MKPKNWKVDHARSLGVLLDGRAQGPASDG
jgi:hypothetical protein